MNKCDLMLLSLAGVLLCILPSAATFTLDIFGNANMDDTINADDIAYLQGIINKTNRETELADANYDGKIDQQDVSAVEEIIRGVETKLVLLDSAGKAVVIKTPVKRIIPVNRNAAEALRTIKTSDEIVAVSDSALNDKSYFPEFQQVLSVGSGKTPDFEKILKENPDLVVYYGTQWTGDYETINDTLKKANPDISVIGLDCFKPETYVEDIMKLGYIVGRVKVVSRKCCNFVTALYPTIITPRPSIDTFCP